MRYSGRWGGGRVPLSIYIRDRGGSRGENFSHKFPGHGSRTADGKRRWRGDVGQLSMIRAQQGDGVPGMVDPVAELFVEILAGLFGSFGESEASCVDLRVGGIAHGRPLGSAGPHVFDDQAEDCIAHLDGGAEGLEAEVVGAVVECKGNRWKFDDICRGDGTGGAGEDARAANGRQGGGARGWRRRTAGRR